MPRFAPLPPLRPGETIVRGAAGPGIRGVQRTAPPIAPRPTAPAVDPVMQQYQSELALLQQIQALYQQQQAQQVAQQRAAYQALAQQLSGIAPQIEGITNRQTEASTSWAKGFADTAAQLANQSTGAAQETVAGFGLPTGNLNPVGASQGNALYGEFGVVPATGFSSYGATQAAAAAMLPGTARLQGENAIARMQSQFQTENLLPLQIERLKLAASLPQRRAEARAEKRQDALGLYEAGLITQREFAKRMGVPNWRRFPDALPGAGPSKVNTSLSRELGYLVDDFGNPIKDRKGKPIYLPEDTSLPPSKTTGGYIWERNPQTGQWEVVGGTGPAPDKPSKPPNLQHVEVKGRTYVFDPGSGLFYDPTTGRATNPNRGGGAVSKSALSAGWKLVKEGKEGWWALKATPNVPLTTSDLQQIAGASLGRLNDLSKEERNRLGIGYFYGEPEEVFLELVRAGIPPRKAKAMVRSQWPSFGTSGPRGLSPPSEQGKGEPASGGAYTGPTDMSPASRQQRKTHAQQIGKQLAAGYGWGSGSEWDALIRLWTNESGWDWLIPNYQGSGAYGIPQALPASKMRSAGADWKTNPATQIKWGLGYIKARYGSPSRALDFWMRQSPHWY